MDETARTSVSCIRVDSRLDTTRPPNMLQLKLRVDERAPHLQLPPRPSSEFDFSMRLVISKPDRACVRVYVAEWHACGECRAERGTIHARGCTVSKGRTTTPVIFDGTRAERVDEGRMPIASLAEPRSHRGYNVLSLPATVAGWLFASRPTEKFDRSGKRTIGKFREPVPNSKYTEFNSIFHRQLIVRPVPVFSVFFFFLVFFKVRLSKRVLSFSRAITWVLFVKHVQQRSSFFCSMILSGTKI